MPKENVKINPPSLSLAIDLGASLTKAIGNRYQDGGVPTLICMEPEIADVSSSSIKVYERQKIGGTDPENRCWVGIGNEYMAVGFLARNKFGGSALLADLKYASAVAKILGTVWVMKEHLGLGQKFTLAMTVLLPPSEYEDRSRLEETLKSALSRYETPSGILNVKLVLFDAKPEGGGIFLTRLQKIGEELKKKVCAIAMVGHRNASVLIVNRGVVNPGKTSEYGSNYLAEKVAEMCSGLDPEDRNLIKAIVEAGDNVEPEPFRKISKSRSAKEQQQDIDKMVEATQIARDEYIRTLTRWLNQRIPKDTEELIFCGGTAFYLRTALEKHYAEVPIIWNADIEIPPELDMADMGAPRLGDVYGVFVSFQKHLQICCLKPLHKTEPVENLNQTPISALKNGAPAAEALKKDDSNPSNAWSNIIAQPASEQNDNASNGSGNTQPLALQRPNRPPNTPPLKKRKP